MTTLDQYMTEAEAAVDSLVRASEWSHLSPATFVALRATVKAGYMQGRLDQAIKAANELLARGAVQARAIAADSEQMAAALATSRPEPDLHEVSQICVTCGTKSVLMSRDPKAPAEVRGVCDRCARAG